MDLLCHPTGLTPSCSSYSTIGHQSQDHKEATKVTRYHCYRGDGTWTGVILSESKEIKDQSQAFYWHFTVLGGDQDHQSKGSRHIKTHWTNRMQPSRGTMTKKKPFVLLMLLPFFGIFSWMELVTCLEATGGDFVQTSDQTKSLSVLNEPKDTFGKFENETESSSGPCPTICQCPQPGIMVCRNLKLKKLTGNLALFQASIEWWERFLKYYKRNLTKNLT